MSLPSHRPHKYSSKSLEFLSLSFGAFVIYCQISDLCIGSSKDCGSVLFISLRKKIVVSGEDIEVEFVLYYIMKIGLKYLLIFFDQSFFLQEKARSQE